jgi:anti-anti-sigma regulatory factor
MESGQIVLDCAQLKNPDLTAVEQIARLQLGVRRQGCELRLTNADPRLRELIGLVGLSGVLRLESQWQSEQRKELGRVEEERKLGDPPT